MKDFRGLLDSIAETHKQLQANAANAVNQALTIRNWLIGFHIVEFEQGGVGRAEYGAGLLASLAEELVQFPGLDERGLRRFRQFYLYYPQLGKAIRGTASPESPEGISIRGTASPESPEEISIRGTASPESPDEDSIRGTASPEFVQLAENHAKLLEGLQLPASKLLAKMSYSHFEQLIKLNDPFERVFYELESVKGTWSVRELKRQIGSRYYQRCGLSGKPEDLALKVRRRTQPQAAKDIIKDIYAFEFLGLQSKTVLEESDLETALLDHLQQFIIELGHGFCFEARQKRLLIGENYYFLDLLFYQRILKCHVVIELKLGAFEHGDIGQLNTYLNFLKAEISEPNDNPPVGILMVAEKDQALVKFATAGMDEHLFVQEYMIKLPIMSKLLDYMEKEIRDLR